MKSRALVLCAGLLVLGMALPPPRGLPVVDQSNNPVPGYQAGGAMVYAQTFTVGVTGLLDHITLDMAASQTTTITVDIEGLSGSGLPDGTLLAYGSASVSTSAYSWYEFPLSNPLTVAPGDKGAIVFDTRTYCSAAGSPNNYPGGQALEMTLAGGWKPVAGPVHVIDAVADFAFATYVIVGAVATPTPAPVAKATPTAAPAPTSTPTPNPAASSSSRKPTAESPSAAALPGSTASALASEPAASASSTSSETPTALAANSTSSGTSGSGSGGSLLPIIAAIIVVLALAGGGLLFILMRRRRRRRTADSTPIAPTPTAPNEAGSLPADSPPADPPDSIPPVGD